MQPGSGRLLGREDLERDPALASHEGPVYLDVRNGSTGEPLPYSLRTSATSATHYQAGEFATLQVGRGGDAVVESPGYRAKPLDLSQAPLRGVISIELVPTNSGEVRLLSKAGVPLVGREVYLRVPESDGEFLGAPIFVLPENPSAHGWARVGLTDAQGVARGVDRSRPMLLTWRESAGYIWPYLLPGSANPAPTIIRSDGVGHELRFAAAEGPSACEHDAAALAARGKSATGMGPWFSVHLGESGPHFLVEPARVQVVSIGELSRVQAGGQVVSGQWLDDSHAENSGVIALQVLSRPHLTFVVSGGVVDAIDRASVRWSPIRDPGRPGWDLAGHELLIQGRRLCAPAHLVRQEVVDRDCSLELRLAGFFPVVIGTDEIRSALDSAQPITIPELERLSSRRVRLLVGGRPFQGVVHAGGVAGRHSPREEVPLQGSGPFELAATSDFITFSIYQAGSWSEVARLDVAATPSPPNIVDVELAVESGAVQIVGGLSDVALWSKETGAVYRPVRQEAEVEVFDPIPAGDYLAGVGPAVAGYSSGRDARLEGRLVPVSVSAGMTESVLLEGGQANVEIEFILPPLLRDRTWIGRLSACPMATNSFYFPAFETVPIVNSRARWGSVQSSMEHVAVFATPPGMSTPMLVAVVGVDQGRASLLGELQSPRRPEGLGEGPYTIRGTIDGRRTSWGGASIYRLQAVVSEEELGLEELPLSVHADGLTITERDGNTVELEAGAP
jgi:hypothetical protein